MKFLKLLCLFICSLLIGTSFLNEKSASYTKTYALTENVETNIYEKIDAYLDESVTKAHFPAMSITIVDKTQTLFSRTYGNCKDTNVPFLLGSVSKSFTALGVMQLVEQEKIDLHSKISKYLPNSTDGERITILQLLNHTSGLGEHQNLKDYKIINSQNSHHYANVNYSLLGKIIEKVSGLKYEEYISKNIFKPLEMTKSAATYEEAKNNGLIDSYQNWFGINVNTNPNFPKNDKAWITVPAGYLSSSTTDLGKYLQMYLNGGKDIISSESINKMFFENVQVEASIPYKYGMGWTLIDETLKQPILRHSGLVETGMSVIYLLPESELGIAIAINSNDYFVGKDMMDRIDWGVALMLMGYEPNIIGDNEYTLRHLLYDFIYVFLLIIAILPLCLINIYNKKIRKGKSWIKIILLILLHLLLPILILLLPQVFFGIPFWVVGNFVPDLFTCLIVSSCLLFVGGISKSILLIFNTRHKI